MRREDREAQPIDTEGYARGMRRIGVLGMQPPDFAEMLSMTIETHTRGRLLRGVHRNQHLELECLLDLHHRRELAHPPEERIAGGCNRVRQPETIGDLRRPFEPTRTKRRSLVGIADTYELAHP